MAARRVSLPSADDLFSPRVPVPAQETRERTVHAVPDREPADRDDDRSRRGAASGRRTPEPASKAKSRRPSGRVRHDEKMTVYVTSEELLEIEHARLSLRREHSLAVDRGRLVREALHLVLADLEQRGEDSALVQRLTED